METVMSEQPYALTAPSPPEAGGPSVTAAGLLESLDAELNALGLRTRLTENPGRLPSLHVQNPEPGASALQELIYAAPRAGGWAFWWSWAEPVASTPAEAAAIIARVLRSADRPLAAGA
jgi:hypothetical protein